MRTIKLNRGNQKRPSGEITEEKPELLRGIRRPGDGDCQHGPGRGRQGAVRLHRAFDRAKITVENIRVTEDEIKTAYEEVDPELSIRHPEGSGQHPFLP